MVQMLDGLKKNTAKTIFNQLDEHKVSWKVYFDTDGIISLTYLIHFPQLRTKQMHFHQMPTFYHDVKHGTLPQYSVIEPRFFDLPNDMHPSDSDNYDSHHSSLLAGENLLHRIYSAIKASNSPKGSNWENTLLIVTFDEAGGTYDHVIPPKATPPSPVIGEQGFAFDRLGLRVPCLFISPWIQSETVISEQLQHTSMLGFLRQLFGIPNIPLNPRDASAPKLPFKEIMSLKTPRDRKEVPVTTAHSIIEDGKPHLITHLQTAVVCGLSAVAGAIAFSSPEKEFLRLDIEAIVEVDKIKTWMADTVKALELFPHIYGKKGDKGTQDTAPKNCCMIL